MVFSWDSKDAEELMEQRLGLSEFQTDGTDTENASDMESWNQLLVSKTDELKKT